MVIRAWIGEGGSGLSGLESGRAVQGKQGMNWEVRISADHLACVSLSEQCPAK